LSGHASTAGNVALGLALDVLHLGAVAVWLGGLAVLAALLVPGIAPDDRPEDVRRVAATFSAYAFFSVVVVVATGVVQSLRQVGSVYALFHTVYGRTLLVKIGLVAVLMALAVVSRWLALGTWALPRPVRRSRGAGRVASEGETPVSDDRGGAIQGLRRSVVAELAIALAVLAVTALLVNAVPARQAAAQPFSRSFSTLGVQVNAIVAPARVGPGNQFHVYVLGRLGQPVAIPELDATISLPARGIGPLPIPLVVATLGHLRALDVTIPLAGDWTLTLTVRTTAIDEQVVTATLPVH
jgi:copper transport protein